MLLNLSAALLLPMFLYIIRFSLFKRHHFLGQHFQDEIQIEEILPLTPYGLTNIQVTYKTVFGEKAVDAFS